MGSTPTSGIPFEVAAPLEGPAAAKMKRVLKKLLWRMGIDLMRIKHSPRVHLLGLRTYLIRSILDIGANFGGFAQTIRAEFPGAHLYCFEPLPGPFEHLSAWAEQQGGTVTAFNVALGDEEREIEMFHHVDHSGSSSILPARDTLKRLYKRDLREVAVTVKQVTLDSIMAQVGTPPRPEILVKIDVQGYEDRVIRGGEATLRQARACILEASAEELYEGQASFEQLVVQLHDLGLPYAGNLRQNCRADGHLTFCNALFLRR